MVLFLSNPFFKFIHVTPNDLQKNRFDSLDSDVFSGLSSLSELHSFHSAFSIFRYSLHLNNNNLQSLPSSIFDNLNSLSSFQLIIIVFVHIIHFPYPCPLILFQLSLILSSTISQNSNISSSCPLYLPDFIHSFYLNTNSLSHPSPHLFSSLTKLKFLSFFPHFHLFNYFL